MSSLAAQIERQRGGCERAGSPLYTRLLEDVAADLRVGGPCSALLVPHGGAAPGDALLLRFLAGVHDLVLAGDAPALATHYPSVGGRPGRGLRAALTATVEDHGDALAAALHRPVQTNEAGRSVALLAGYLALAATVDLPLRILEIGASAGLNLCFDRFRTEAGSHGFGPPDAPLRFVDPYVGAAPDLDRRVPVAERRGCDLDPIDASTDGGRRRLRSFVWADQLDRLDRLDAALGAIGEPPEVDRADGLDWLVERLEAPTPGRCTVVVHAIVLQYLAPDRRAQLLEVIDAAGARADHEAPFAWLRTEPGGAVAETRLTVWPGGVPTVVATSGFHGPPVTLGRAA